MTKPAYLANKYQGVLDAHVRRDDENAMATLLAPLPAAISDDEKYKALPASRELNNFG